MRSRLRHGDDKLTFQARSRAGRHVDGSHVKHTSAAWGLMHLLGCPLVHLDNRPLFEGPFPPWPTRKNPLGRCEQRRARAESKTRLRTGTWQTKGRQRNVTGQARGRQRADKGMSAHTCIYRKQQSAVPSVCGLIARTCRYHEPKHSPKLTHGKKKRGSPPSSRSF